VSSPSSHKIPNTNAIVHSISLIFLFNLLFVLTVLTVWHCRTVRRPLAGGYKVYYGHRNPPPSRDNLTGGFALVAYPERWGQSGIMTFTVNQDGKVYQRNFGERTSRIAGAMKEYNPDSQWTLVPEEGVLRAVSEK
jgi:hypothetical protein